MSHRSPHRLLGADVVVADGHADLAATVAPVLAGGPFRLASVAPAPGGTLLRFVAAEPDIAVSWRNVVELQWRLGAEVEIVTVERQGPEHAPALGLAVAGV